MVLRFWPILTVSVLCTLIPSLLGLRLGAFNVKVFGPSKASKEDVMSILARIAVRYDILLIQEIRDSKGQAIEKLRLRIQQDHGVNMMLITSDRLGRTSSKEQYAFLYRADHGLSVVDSFHFDDGDESLGVDSFGREPFIVRFQALNCEVRDFALVALHTSPRETVEELTALTQVVEDIRSKWGVHTNILIMGDLNADCDYVPKKAWPGIPIRQDSQFWWPITDDVDTTVNANTNCAYDSQKASSSPFGVRFIVASSSLREAVLAGSAQPFDFPVEYGLTADQAMAVSDHYPIELTLQDRTSDTHQTSSHASGHSGFLERLQHLWHGIADKLSRWRLDSEL